MSERNVPATMKAAVMTKPGEIRIEERPVPQVQADEVLIQVMAVGVCGSDVHYYEHGRIGRFVVEKPIILGHECAGIIAAVGSSVTRVSVGDRVAIEPGVTCGRCSACKEGRYNLCPDVQFLATPPVDGAFVQYMAIREDMVFPIPDHLSFEEAALNEPFSVGIHAAKRSRLQPGTTVAIMGMGPVGLMAVAAAKSFGASRIIVTDLEQVRLDAAKRLGATEVINVREEDPVARIKELTQGIGVDTAWETAGNPRALQSALYSLRRGGKLAIVGLPPQDEIALNVPFIADNEVDIYGIFRYANTYPSGIEFLASGQIDAKSLITDRYPLAQTQDAMERAIHNKSGSLKVMVYPNE
ncbi:NAD(P)-dependent alcohol dehydrogenase [Paenibacillus hexagrammi]|uniref:NAD(P)-dependent alcohol dehydrogenase n=1 Tax=Paenibacillus hexagrammi TaxID=2908839 RepID=A0ABY3SIK7_9BACL|nr:NAD(P)-dependent alcohol dehydrogenase [Paenibacillus sp. YPD9-1]UJF33877.1 NAD(P)-dependent alcohol dehydrogenase [Paenibacillus sp. YPD9-1]